MSSLISGTGSYDSNQDLCSSGNQSVYSVSTALSTDLMARTPTSNFNLSANLNYPYYDGPGADDLTSELFWNLGTGYTKETELNTYGLSASFSTANTNTTQLEDTGLLNVDAVQRNISVSGSIGHQVSELNSLSLTAGWSMVDFSGDGADEFVPSDSLSLTGA